MHLVLFDFDGTLTRRDSLMPFLQHVSGTHRFALGIARMSPVLAAFALKLVPNDVAKRKVLHHFLNGRRLDALMALGETFAGRGLPGLLRDDTMQALRRHVAAGDTCVLVSASLDIYLEPWAEANGFAAVLCSRLQTTPDGRVDGRLLGGNCFGPIKENRVRQWLGDVKPERITAYGDSRGDLELLRMADTPNWVGRKRYS
jgi:phosphatidylglycerophosphatase C